MSSENSSKAHNLAAILGSLEMLLSKGMACRLDDEVVVEASTDVEGGGARCEKPVIDVSVTEVDDEVIRHFACSVEYSHFSHFSSCSYP